MVCDITFDEHPEEADVGSLIITLVLAIGVSCAFGTIQPVLLFTKLWLIKITAFGVFRMLDNLTGKVFLQLQHCLCVCVCVWHCCKHHRHYKHREHYWLPFYLPWTPQTLGTTLSHLICTISLMTQQYWDGAGGWTHSPGEVYGVFQEEQSPVVKTFEMHLDQIWVDY